MKNKKDELFETLNYSQNFYVEELEDRLEMTTATPNDGIVPNDVCWAVAIKF